MIQGNYLGYSGGLASLSLLVSALLLTHPAYLILEILKSLLKLFSQRMISLYLATVLLL